MRFGQDVRVAALSYRSIALWMLGYPEAALADADRALKEARAFGQAATLMFALITTSYSYMFCGNYATANAQLDQGITVALLYRNAGPFHELGRCSSPSAGCRDRSSTTSMARRTTRRSSDRHGTTAHVDVFIQLRHPEPFVGEIVGRPHRLDRELKHSCPVSAPVPVEKLS
jgi:hypothetical protein